MAFVRERGVIVAHDEGPRGGEPRRRPGQPVDTRAENERLADG